jgi:hypothetical protein
MAQVGTGAGGVVCVAATAQLASYEVRDASDAKATFHASKWKSARQRLMNWLSSV